MGVGNNTIVYEVPGLLLSFFLNVKIKKKKTGFSIETTSIDAILQQLGINTNTLQPSSTLNNYYRSK